MLAFAFFLTAAAAFFANSSNFAKFALSVRALVSSSPSFDPSLLLDPVCRLGARSFPSLNVSSAINNGVALILGFCSGGEKPSPEKQGLLASSATLGTSNLRFYGSPHSFLGAWLFMVVFGATCARLSVRSTSCSTSLKFLATSWTSERGLSSSR